MAAGVGVLALYSYFPPYVVQQADLEAQDGVPGKYTIGLGQGELCFGSDREDPVSMALTAAVRLVEAYGVSSSEIGRIEVGSEGGVDRSKSIKSYLCQHFAAQGNTSIEGADSMHGCYGGTAALLNCVNWCESRSWDGRLALAVASDVAIYAPGCAARPTGGSGAVAMLIGPGAALQLAPPPWRATHSIHCFDFFKPHSSPLYPVLDGPATLEAFLGLLDACAALLHARLAAAGHIDKHGTMLPLFDAFVSHAPFNKMVKKAFSRLLLQDLLRAARSESCNQQAAEASAPALHAQGMPAGNASAAKQQAPAGEQNVASACQPAACLRSAGNANGQQMPQLNGFAAGTAGTEADLSGGRARSQAEVSASQVSGLQSERQQHCVTQASPASAASALLPPSAHGLDPNALSAASRSDKALERALLAAAEPLYNSKVADSTWLQRRCGNQYTASLFGGLAALLERRGAAALLGQRLLLYSFGSGAVASLLVLEVGAGSGRFTLEAMCSKSDLQARLAQRVPATPANYATACEGYARAYSSAPNQPSGSIPHLGPRAAYLDRVDDKHRRWYAWTPAQQEQSQQQNQGQQQQQQQQQGEQPQQH